MDKLKENGSLGYIVSNKFMVTDYGEKLRVRLATKHNVTNIIDFGDKQVFKGASTYTCILVVDKKNPTGTTALKLINRDPEPSVFETGAADVENRIVDLNSFGESRWELSAVGGDQERPGFKALGDMYDIFQGVRTSDNGVFVLSKCKLKDGVVTGYSKALKKTVELEPDLCRPFLRGREIGRNYHAKVTQNLLFPYEKDDPYKLIPFRKLKSDFPKGAAYLQACERRLRKREGGEYDQTSWYGFIRLQNHELISKPKVMVQSIASRANLTLDVSGKTFFVTGYGIRGKNREIRSVENYRFIQAIMKSARIDKQIKATTSRLRGGAYEYRKQFLENIIVPIWSCPDSVDGLRLTGLTP